jgi:hypothetical protein
VRLLLRDRADPCVSSSTAPPFASGSTARLRRSRYSWRACIIDAQALADVLGSLGLQQSGGAQHIAIDGKTMRASKDSNGVQTVLGHGASRGKVLEIPDALKLLGRLDVKGKNCRPATRSLPEVDYCQDRRARGDYVLPVKDNQKALRQDIETAFNDTWDSGVEKAHGRASNGAPSMCCRPPTPGSGLSASGRRSGKSAVSNVGASSGKTASGKPPQHKVVHLMSSLSVASNRNHRGIEIMRRTSFSARTATLIVATTRLPTSSPSPALC